MSTGDNQNPAARGGSINLLKKLYYRLFKRYRRIELRVCTWEEASDMIELNIWKEEKYRWILALEENYNCHPGIVYMERRERIIS